MEGHFLWAQPIFASEGTTGVQSLSLVYLMCPIAIGLLGKTEEFYVPGSL